MWEVRSASGEVVDVATSFKEARKVVEGVGPYSVSAAEEGEADSPVFVRVERWSDGSIFFEGPGGCLDFARLRRDNQADAAKWLERAAQLFALVKKDG